MKTRLYTLLLMGMALMLSLPSLHAQIEDHDPGMFFVIEKDSGIVSLNEGMEWTITFECEDTLGVEYSHPVSMHFEGGDFNSSTNIQLQKIDSILMYRPEPILAEGVYEITREHFPYIIGIDSTYTIIYFSKDIDGVFPLPEVGTKVVCNYEEQPLPYGFLGEVLSVVCQDNYYEVSFNIDWKSLTDYFDYAILVFKPKNTEETEENSFIQDCPRRSILRNSKKVNAKKRKKYDDISWPITASFSKNYDFSEQSSSDSEPWGLFDIPSFVIGVDASLTVLIDGRRESITDDWVNYLKGSDMSLTFNYGIKSKLSINLNATFSEDFPIPGLAIKPLERQIFGGRKIVINAGFYLHGDFTADFNLGQVTFDFVTDFADGKSESYDDRISDYFTFELANLMLKGNISIPLKASFSIVNTEKSKELDLSFVTDLISLSGTCIFTTEDYQQDTPEQLFYAWNQEKEHFKLDAKLVDIYATALINPDIQLFKDWTINLSLDGKYPIFTGESWSSTYLPKHKGWTSYWFDPINQGDTQGYYYHMNYGPYVLLPWNCAIWVYDLQKKSFTIKKELWSGNALTDEKSGQTDTPFTLRKGEVFQFVEVFARKGIESDFMTDNVPEPIRIPYSMYDTGCEVLENNSVALTSKFDEQAILDHNAGLHYFEAGFQCLKIDEESSLSPEEQIDKHPEKAFYPSVNLGELTTKNNSVYYRVPELEGGKYICRSYLSVEDELGKHEFFGATSKFTMNPTPALYVSSVQFNPGDYQARVNFKTSDAFKLKCNQAGYLNVNIILYITKEYPNSTTTVSLQYNPYDDKGISPIDINIDPDSKYSMYLTAQFPSDALLTKSPYHNFETWSCFNKDNIKVDAKSNEATIEVFFENYPSTSYDYYIDYKLASESWCDQHWKLCTESMTSIVCTLKDLEQNKEYNFRVLGQRNGTPVFRTLWEKTFKTKNPVSDEEEWVDLGLPSQVLWRAWNLGASWPSMIGDYYSWGENTPKETFSYENYNPGNPFIENMNTLDSPDVDPALKSGIGRMPTKEEVEELVSYVTWEKKKRDGVWGSLGTGPNGQQIFFPNCGYYNAGSGNITNENAAYIWTNRSAEVDTGIGSVAYNMQLKGSSGTLPLPYSYVYDGLPIRPVKNK